MAEYYLLDDNPQVGKAMMSLEAIANIATTSIRNVKDAYPMKKDHDTTSVKILKNGSMVVNVKIYVVSGTDIARVCEELQREVYDHILDMTDIKVSAVNIDVVGFINLKEE